MTRRSVLSLLVCASAAGLCATWPWSHDMAVAVAVMAGAVCFASCFCLALGA